ncbi:MAG: peptidylprolyl isomerase [Gammaproteobacteria bacterium]|nr:peptidylprolyl isomerase [Gammaproteobacteria bacterium]
MSNIEAITIGPASVVTMNFSLTLKDGTVADASEPGAPMTFTMGDGSLIQGLELALYGLKTGDKQTLEISPHDAFGFPDETNIHTLPRQEFPADIPLDYGIIVNFSTPNGVEVPGTILAVEGDEVKVDFNHPLAGLPVIFSVEILAIEMADTPIGG